MKRSRSELGPRTPEWKRRLTRSGGAFARRWRPLLALLLALSIAQSLEGSCIYTRPPERELWIEVVSCSDQVLREVSTELFVQAAGRTNEDWTGNALPRATQLLREKPGVLIVAREIAFADSALPFYSLKGGVPSEALYSDRPGIWQSSGARPDRRFFLGSAIATCETLVASGRLVVREVSNCCDTGRGPGLACILQVSELVLSAKKPPTPEQLTATDLP